MCESRDCALFCHSLLEGYDTVGEEQISQDGWSGSMTSPPLTPHFVNNDYIMAENT